MPERPCRYDRFWREADIRKTATPAQHATSPLLGHLQTFLVGRVLVRSTLKADIAAWTARPRPCLAVTRTRETNAKVALRAAGKGRDECVDFFRSGPLQRALTRGPVAYPTLL